MTKAASPFDPSSHPAGVFRAMVAMFNTGDVSGVAAVVADHYLDHQGLAGRPMRGGDGFAAVVTAARSDHRELTVTIEDLIEGDDRVAARLRWRATDRSGRVDERETIEIVRVADGRAVEHWGGRS